MDVSSQDRLERRDRARSVWDIAARPELESRNRAWRAHLCVVESMPRDLHPVRHVNGGR